MATQNTTQSEHTHHYILTLGNPGLGSVTTGGTITPPPQQVPCRGLPGAREPGPRDAPHHGPVVRPVLLPRTEPDLTRPPTDPSPPEGHRSS